MLASGAPVISAVNLVGFVGGFGSGAIRAWLVGLLLRPVWFRFSTV